MSLLLGGASTQTTCQRFFVFLSRFFCWTIITSYLPRFIYSKHTPFTKKKNWDAKQIPILWYREVMRSGGGDVVGLHLSQRPSQCFCLSAPRRGC